MESDNLREERAKRLLEWSKDGEAPPLRLIIFTTSRCNLRCRMCTRTYTYPKSSTDILEIGEMPTERWLAIVKDALDMGVKEFWIPGAGEPMMRADTVIRLMEEIKNPKYDTSVLMTTNGTMFTPLIIRKFVQLGVDTIQFSIDAAEPSLHDHLRGVKGTFNRAIKTIRLFKYYKKIFGTDRPKILINSIVTEKSYTDIDKLVEIASDLGCNKVKLNKLIVYDDAAEKVKGLIVKNDSKLVEKLDEVKELKNVCYMSVSPDSVTIEIKNNSGEGTVDQIASRTIDQPQTGASMSATEASEKGEADVNKEFLSLRCFEPWYNVAIDPYGFVTPCCNWGKGKEEFTIVGKTLEEVWHGDSMNYFRSMVESKNLEGPCKTCSMGSVSDEIRSELASMPSKEAEQAEQKEGL